MDLSRDFSGASQIYHFLHQSKFYSICLLRQHPTGQDHLSIAFVDFSDVKTFYLGGCLKN